MVIWTSFPANLVPDIIDSLINNNIKMNALMLHYIALTNIISQMILTCSLEQ